MAYKRILVPVDGSPTAAKGLKAAIKLAREARGKLCLVHVVEQYPALAMPDAGVDITPMLEATKAAGRKTLARIERSARAAGARPETALAEGFGGRVADRSSVRQALAPTSSSWARTGGAA